MEDYGGLWSTIHYGFYGALDITCSTVELYLLPCPTGIFRAILYCGPTVAGDHAEKGHIVYCSSMYVCGISRSTHSQTKFSSIAVRSSAITPLQKSWFYGSRKSSSILLCKMAAAAANVVIQCSQYNKMRYQSQCLKVNCHHTAICENDGQIRSGRHFFSFS